MVWMANLFSDLQGLYAGVRNSLARKACAGNESSSVQPGRAAIKGKRTTPNVPHVRGTSWEKKTRQRLRLAGF